MLFNIEKCSVIQFGGKNLSFQYEIGGVVLQESEEERDLRVIIHHSAKPSRQCTKAAKTAKIIFGMTKRTIVSRETDRILRLYKTLVRPHLEYLCKHGANT
jgi:ribonucleases P/MRP protein subunit RPP40